MMETDNSSSPAPKKDDDELLALINEMTQDSKTEPELVLLSTEVPPSGDGEDDVLELNEEVLIDEGDNGLLTFSEQLHAAIGDVEEEDILDLNLEVPQAESMDVEPPELSEEIFASENSDEDILELSDEAPLPEEADNDVITLSEEVTGGVVETDDFFDMNELPSLLSGDTSETGGISGNVGPKEIQHAKDLVPDGFELGEALDVAIDKEIYAGNGLTGALGLGLEYESSGEAPVGRFDGSVPSVSSTQLEAAIERVIDKMLGRKIDSLLTTAIERAITSEINRLKRILSEALPDD